MLVLHVIHSITITDQKFNTDIGMVFFKNEYRNTQNTNFFFNIPDYSGTFALE